MQVPPLFLDIPAAVHLLILSIYLMLFFVSAPFRVKQYFLEAQLLDLQDLLSPVD